MARRYRIGDRLRVKIGRGWGDFNDLSECIVTGIEGAAAGGLQGKSLILVQTPAGMVTDRSRYENRFDLVERTFKVGDRVCVTNARVEDLVPPKEGGFPHGAFPIEQFMGQTAVVIEVVKAGARDGIYPKYADVRVRYDDEAIQGRNANNFDKGYHYHPRNFTLIGCDDGLDLEGAELAVAKKEEVPPAPVWKVGDRVKVILGDAGGLPLNAITSILKVNKISLRVALENGIEDEGPWGMERFEVYSDALMKMRTDFAKVMKDHHPGCCSWTQMSKDGHVSHKPAMICHAALGYGSSQIMQLVLNTSAHRRTHASPEAYDKFIHHMLNESPWAPYYVTKDVKEAHELGVVMNMDKGKNFVVSAAIALREGSEYPQVAPRFAYWLDQGVAPRVAWVLAQYTEGDVDELKMLETHSGHRAHGVHHTKENLIRFFRDGYDETKYPHPYKDAKGGDYSIQSCIGPEREGGTTFHAFMVEFTTSKGEGFARKTNCDKEQIQSFINELTKLIIK